MKQLLTHSRMQSFKTCRRRAFYEYELGIRREVDGKALRIGSAGHDALDVLRKTGDQEQALEAVRQYYATCPEEFDQYEWEIERETVECLVAGYHWRWSEYPLEVIESEQSFKLPVRNPETGAASPIWDAAGKIDGIVSIDERKLVLESKFISDSIEQDSDYWRLLQIDQQITNYTKAARELGHEVSGVLYDVIRKPTIKPTPVPVLDGDGKKIVLGADGNRIYNEVKPKKKCANCEGTGIHKGTENRRCLCTVGAPRQASDKEQGWELQNRPMTVEEWSEKLLADIFERPEYYYARNEIARLDDDIEEFKAEMWEIQQTIREAQRSGRWFKTVNRNTCSFCAYQSLCLSNFHDDGATAPEGFVRVEDVHPELV